MSKFTIIVAVDEQGGIGKDQQLLCYLPQDLAFFKQHTMGKPMIMGRKTYESIGRPLPGRRSIVLTTKNIEIPGVEIAQSIEQARNLCLNDPEIMVIGGAAVYEQFIPHTQKILMTLIHHRFAADKKFPEFDHQLWQRKILKEFKADDKTLYDLTFMAYTKS